VPDLAFRDAVAEDVPAIVGMYADDVLGREREDLSDPLPDYYFDAFREIAADQRQRLIVAELDGQLVGTLQLSFLPHLVLRGGERAQIEAVRVRADKRGAGVGEALLGWAIEKSKRRGCRLIQLTTNAKREDARRFYEKLGFSATHLGMKLALDPLDDER
jgi:GNAT superfamily N-acetyltransferase